MTTNALKYAFKEGVKGKFKIRISMDETEKHVLKISDNGPGLPENINFKRIKSLGLKLVTGLVKQIGGKLEVNRSNGTEYIICFNS